MKMSIIKIIISILFCIFAAFLRCTSRQVTGVGTGSETVIGRVIHGDGKPAGETFVTLYPFDYDPVKDSGLVICADTTDSNGNYSIVIPSSDIKLYTLHAINQSMQTRTIVPDIEITDSESTFVENASLQKTGSIKIILPDSSDDKNGYVFIPGTIYHSYIENGNVIIDSVPAQTIRNVYYNDYHPNGAQNLSENINVKPQTTTVIVDSRQIYSRKIFLNTSPIGANIDGVVTDFPVLIRLRANNFDFSQVNENGSDLRFTKSNGTPIPYEIEMWDYNNSEADIWVKVDTVYGNDSTQFISIYWGDDNAGNSDGAAVFDTATGFQAVWHLGDNKENVMDATANGNNGLKQGNQSLTQGNIGFGQFFNGSGDYTDMGNVCNPEMSDFTVSAWIKMSGVNKIQTIISKSNGGLPNSGYGWLFQLDENGALQIYMATDTGVWGDKGSFVLSSNIQITDSGWHHAAAVIDRSNSNNCRVYIDGEDVSTLPSGGNIADIGNVVNFLPLRIGSDADGQYQWEGALDECWVSYRTHSPDYIKLCYMNQKGENKLVVFK